MSDHLQIRNAIVSLDKNPRIFEQVALEVFGFQYDNNEVYRQYVDNLGRNIHEIDRIEKIPFLPIEFFKYHKIVSGSQTLKTVFESSGTTQTQNSRHYVSDLNLYEHLSRKTFEQHYGSATDYHILALLPSYVERNNSSLVYMVQKFIEDSYSPYSGFYGSDYEKLFEALGNIGNDNRKILLIGVSFALLDFSENNAYCSLIKKLKNKLIIMETGGMKGRRKELTREELHSELTQKFGVKAIHSEYGMTELLSQAYSLGNGLFEPSHQMKIFLREINDPFALLPAFALGQAEQEVKYRGKTGGINVVDLANLYSCSFIETKDLGAYTPDYRHFKVLGRFDNSDVRGCNLLMT